ncbi:Aste57867_25206 [Aphanomyces stellatus]|uniref:Aste57867_25206 protein n=1 Tax=Aphanomyces stellatus TaxID=120398 RepID=A0A485LSK6_9STRA|nr:hypothetical protein As57867_025128 [Aphanomyces stellatus]VFU01833.1 Aste57867_25206 [Aphanomyces stellatus]
MQSILLRLIVSVTAAVFCVSVDAQLNPDAGSTSSSSLPPTTGGCIASKLISSSEATGGVNVFSDNSCSFDAINCVASTYCRKCKQFETPISSGYPSCPQSAFPIVVGASQIRCPSYLYTDESAAGISAIYDAQCPISGGKGCFSTGLPCRRCLVNITSGQDFHPCELNPCLPSAVVNINGTVGILDIHCASSTPPLAGCISSTSCRLCWLDKNEQNAHLTSCASVLWSSPRSSPTTSPSPSTKSPPTSTTTSAAIESVRGTAIETFEEFASPATHKELVQTTGTYVALYVVLGVAGTAVVVLIAFASHRCVRLRQNQVAFASSSSVLSSIKNAPTKTKKATKKSKSPSKDRPQTARRLYDDEAFSVVV